jgi:hypothetical protein
MEWQGNAASGAEPRAHTAEARRFAERDGAATEGITKIVMTIT